MDGDGESQEVKCLSHAESRLQKKGAVLKECREHMNMKHTVLLSAIEAALSVGSRAYLKKEHLSLVDFFQQFPEQFVVDGARGEVTYLSPRHLAMVPALFFGPSDPCYRA